MEKAVSMRISRKSKHDDYFSIILVPNSTNKVKTIKISSLRYKLYIASTIALTAVICFGLYFGNIVLTNVKLKNELAKAYDINEQQSKLLAENAEQISSMLQANEQYSKTISEFSEKYKQMTESYVNGSMNSLTASRGENSRTFINDATELKNILENLQEINKLDSSVVNNLSKTEAKLQTYIDAIPTLWPVVGRISSEFGSREDPFNSSEKNHAGMDIAASEGTSIKAAASGKVTFAGKKGNYGNCVIINHSSGITTLYGHASKLLVKEGQKVKKGDVIAKVGSTGRSTGPHLHFEVRINGTPVNPRKYLDKK